jgi:serine kinase of HPr protein (carbohydrate metabolism regulator)
MLPKRFHSTSLVVEDSGILIIGESGIGKSDLALRMIDSGAMLIADDITICKKINNFIYLFSPEETKGLLEVREIGIITVPFIENIKLSLVVQLINEENIRYPENENYLILGIKVPKIKIYGKNSSAVAKIKVKLNQIKNYV